MSGTEAPVLFITFNRPNETRIVFEAIREAKPKKLYLFSDGPRADSYEADLEKILLNRKLADEIDWDCKISTRFLTDNAGCGPGVSGAVNWVMEHEDRVIVLEDDCVPSQSFFLFCNVLLRRYEHDLRVMNISGTRWNDEYLINGCDYYYTRYTHIWGWATWRRAWQHYDYEMKDWPLFRDKMILNRMEANNAPIIKRWNLIYNKLYYMDKKDTWDYQWQYAIHKNNGYSLNCVKNLVTNIGVNGMHSFEKRKEHNRARHTINEPLQPPPFPYLDLDFETYHGRHFFLRDRSGIRLLYDHIAGKLSFLNR